MSTYVDCPRSGWIFLVKTEIIIARLRLKSLAKKSQLLDVVLDAFIRGQCRIRCQSAAMVVLRIPKRKLISGFGGNFEEIGPEGCDLLVEAEPAPRQAKAVH